MGFVVMVVVVVVAVLSSPLSLSLSLLLLLVLLLRCLVPLLSLFTIALPVSLSLSLVFFLSLLQSIKTQPPLFLAVFFIPGKKQSKDSLRKTQRERESVSDFFIYRHRKVLHFLLFFCL